MKALQVQLDPAGMLKKTAKLEADIETHEERNLIRRIQRGTVRLEHLMAAGAVQLGLVPGDYAANGCPRTGNGCVNVYAVSIAGVMPARDITWFQAAAAARNSLKRLPTNQEWQVAALGPFGTLTVVLRCAIAGDVG